MVFSKLFSPFQKNVILNNPPDVFNELKEKFKSFDLFIDVGAYHGNFIQKFKHNSPKAEVHAFEPFPKAFQVLSERFAGFYEVVLNKTAVSNFYGKAEFYSNAGEETNSLHKSMTIDDTQIDKLTKNITTTEVSVTTLDEYTDRKGITNIDFLKIDTQGSTFEVLQGAAKLLKKRVPRFIYAETEFVEIYSNEKRFSEIEIFMRSNNYELVKFYNINYTSSGNIAWADALFRAK
jgi:FkbM family methyltransferase